MRNCKHCNCEVDDDTLYLCPECGRILPKIGEKPSSGGSSSGSTRSSTSGGGSSASSASSTSSTSSTSSSTSSSTNSGSGGTSGGASAFANAGGGLLAWSIFNILLCTIPGVAALVLTVKGRAHRDAAMQAKYFADAKIWNFVATIAGVAILVGYIVMKLS